MRTTIDIPSELLNTAKNISGLKTKKSIITKALEILIEKESAKKLSLYFGSIPEITIDLDITRQRCKKY